MARVELTNAAIDDLINLDGSVLPRVLKKLLLLETHPLAGGPLGRRSGSNLTTFRKLVVGNRDWRIIYRIQDDDTLVVIWVIASRTDDDCYREASRRLATTTGPETLILRDAISRLSASALKRAQRVIKPD